MRHYNKKYLYIGLTIFLSLSAVILFYYVLFYGENFTQVKSSAINVLLPIIDGIVIAYILSPMQDFVEKNIVKRLIDKIPNKKGKSRRKLIRGLSTS